MELRPYAGLVFAVDFDGTMVEHRYPAIGDPVPDAVRVVKRLMGAGGKIVLWTMRSSATLRAAQAYMEENDIELYGVNANPVQKDWTDSPKAYAQVYIDDAAIGCPLTLDPMGIERPYVNWSAVEKLLFPDDIINS